MIRLVYETHSTTVDNEAGNATGWLPGELSAAGREQARELGERRHDVDAVFSSDLGRALETVMIAFGVSDLPVLHDWRLREVDYGVLNGAPASELERGKHVDVPYPGGESYRDVVGRVASLLDDLRRGWTGNSVLVVSHAAPRWALQHLIEGVRLEELVEAPFDWQPGWEFRIETP
ncbi:MAG TPA: histidine phosphatase family protein [Gaiellaceae bacterium]|nr:histidine phosphatase family protein [Gaiellaceae bacterium]